MGEFGAHLKMVARATGVDVGQRGSNVVIGAGPGAAVAERAISQLHDLVRAGHALHPQDVEHGLRILLTDPTATLRTYFDDTVLVTPQNRPIVPRSPGQRRYVQALRQHDVVFGVGPAGTGKTFLAVAMAVAWLRRNDVRRIVLTRPAVEAGEKLGFLPGDLHEKVDPYLRPLYDALDLCLTPERTLRLLERRVIEIAPLAFMRGRTLSDAAVVLDEAQNTTAEQMKMFLTRLGDGGRMVITGDDTQIDLPRGRTSGLVDALDVLSDVERVGVVRFDSGDVVRHPLVADVIDAYESARQRRLGLPAVAGGER